MTEDQIKHMVGRFLSWRLPKPWNPDNGISYKRPNYAHAPADHDWPTGTNLFDYTQADAMVRYMLTGLPGAVDPAKCGHFNRRGVGSAGSDGSSSYTGRCLDCGKDLSYKIDGAKIPANLESQISN